MNKIFTFKTIDAILKEYRSHVEPIVRRRLNILIGFLLLKEESISQSNLEANSFYFDSKKYETGNDLSEKKKIINLFFKKIEGKNQVKYSGSNLIIPDLSIAANFKTKIKNETYDSSKFIEIAKNLTTLIKDPINIDAGSFLAKHKSYCINLSQNEKVIINTIFPYSEIFQEKENKIFYASTLASNLNTPVCPYCNREYINSVLSDSNGKVIGPTFDHFLSQKDYPYLKLSFYNLIPSCTTCNSRLKNQIEFDFDNFLYPYQDSYENMATFKLKYNRHAVISKFDDSKLIKEEVLSISLKTINKHINKLHGDGVDWDEKGSLNVFKTEHIYNESHKDVAYDILQTFKRTPKTQIDSIAKAMNVEGKSEADIYRFYHHNYLEEKDFNKRPLSRMTRDIVKQLEEVYGVSFTANAK